MDKNQLIRSATINVSISGLNIFWGYPPTNISGKIMAIVEIVPANTGIKTSFVPL